MKDRLSLHTELVHILGSNNVYFQPPETMKLHYPAIIYSRQKINNSYADDTIYKQNRSYEVTVIDYDPDSIIVDKISKMSSCRHDRHFKSDNLNHDSFTIIY